MTYKRKRNKRRKRIYIQNKVKFVRSILVVTVIVALSVVGCNMVKNKNNKSDTLNVSPSPSVNDVLPAASAEPSEMPTSSAEPSASPTSSAEPSASPTSSAEPSASPEASGEPSASPVPTEAAASGDTLADADLLKVVKKSDGVKVAYLTFDDGPTKKVTPAVLDVLRRYNVKATFFQVGYLIKDNADMARRVYEDGHFIANHSYGHEYGELYSSANTFMSELDKTQQLIDEITDGTQEMHLMRFPGGSYNAGSYKTQKQEYKKLLAEKGMYYCDWNALSKDAEGKKNKNAQELFEATKETVGTQEDVVILMHDANGKMATAEALPLIIEYLQGEGYEFRRLDDKA